MSKTMKLGEYEIKIHPEKLYQVFHEEITGERLLKLSFLHITDWLDQKVLKNEIELWSRIPVMFHPKVFRSLMQEDDASIYWGLDIHEQLKVFRRELHKYGEKDNKKRQMAREIDLADPTIRKKKYRLTNSLVDKGYDRETAMKAIASLIGEHGTGVMGLKSAEIMKMVDELLIN